MESPACVVFENANIDNLLSVKWQNATSRYCDILTSGTLINYRFLMG